MGDALINGVNYFRYCTLALIHMLVRSAILILLSVNKALKDAK